MQYIIIYKKNNEKKIYELKVYNPRNVLLVAFFLDEVGYEGMRFIKWFTDQKNDAWNNNLVDCIIDEGIVEFTPAYILDPKIIYSTGNFFQMSFDLFINMLRQWSIIRPLEPDYIQILINAQKVEIKSIDENELFIVENIKFMLEEQEKIKPHFGGNIVSSGHPTPNAFPPYLPFLIEGELNYIESGRLLERFILLEQTLALFFSYLNNDVKNPDIIQEYFIIAKQVQKVFSLLLTKKIDLPSRFIRFLHDFNELQQEYLIKIKNGDYVF